MAAVFASLTWVGLRARWQPTLLTIVVVTCAMATATLARAVGGLADDPWQQTFAATNGAHVIGIGGPQTRWQAVSTAPEALAVAGPFQTAFASLQAGTRRAPVLLREADVRPSAIDRPLLVSGRWLHAGEVVLERSLAAELGLRVGDRVRLESTAARVAGIVVTSSQQAFPASQPGVVFARRATLTAIAPDRMARGTMLAVRLRDSADAEAFANRAAQLTGGAAQFQTWGKRRADAGADTRTNQVVLSVFTLFLLLISAAVIATLVSARVVERSRTVATLAAIGCTPRQATTAFAAEQVAVGLVGVLLGSAVGTVLAPQFVERSSALLNVVPPASLELMAAVLVGLVALVLIGAIASVAAWRAGRGAVVDGLRGVRRGRDRPSRGARFADRLRLPAAAGLAARDALSPRARATLSVLALSITVATVVAVLAMEATLDASATAAARPAATLPPPPGGVGLPAPYVGDTSADSAAHLRCGGLRTVDRASRGRRGKPSGDRDPLRARASARHLAAALARRKHAAARRHRARRPGRGRCARDGDRDTDRVARVPAGLRGRQRLRGRTRLAAGMATACAPPHHDRGSSARLPARRGPGRPAATRHRAAGGARVRSRFRNTMVALLCNVCSW